MPYNLASVALREYTGCGPKAIRKLYYLQPSIQNIVDVRYSLTKMPQPYKFSRAQLVGV